MLRVSFIDASNESNYFVINGGETFDKIGLEKLEKAWKNNRSFDMQLLKDIVKIFMMEII